MAGRTPLAASGGEQAEWPSVAALLITYKRPELLLEALAQIGSQDYPGHVEAVVIDDSPESSAAQIDAMREQGVALPEIRYVYQTERMSIGGKRNLAARSTDAEVLAVWDDDDVFTADRLRKQVEHLRGGGVACSAIEVAAMYSVPNARLTVRPTTLPQIVFENTLCFTRAWWEANNCKFGDAWEVSGQGEGTLEPWWEEVRPLTGAEEPFLYIYLPSSVSGGTAVYLDPHPAPDDRLFALVRALSAGRFPDALRGPHVRGALAGARSCLTAMLEERDGSFLVPGAGDVVDDYEAFVARYTPVRERYLERNRAENR